MCLFVCVCVFILLITAELANVCPCDFSLIRNNSQKIQMPSVNRTPHAQTPLDWPSLCRRCRRSQTQTSWSWSESAGIAGGEIVYFSFFLGRSWLVWPHFFLRQFVARGGRRAL
ncbi:hypothetical protein F5Y14DRAFT_416612 [Nemania sp. NC0429]|nr:hypothetical protein F5Y14DRAFT_416612 [Nemania sp. NC0429]